MAFVKAIKFRHLESQLTQSERIKFCGQLSDNLVTNALFCYFISKSPNAELENDNVNELLCKIMASRKKKPNTAIIKPNLKIDDIPKQLIGSIASFTQQKDYINFSKSNRSVYLGCNTPNLMHELDLLKVADYSSINLSLYRSVKAFKFELNKFKEFKFNEQFVMPQLQSITLYGVGNDADLDAFLAGKVSSNRVTQLVLNEFGRNFNGNKFVKIAKLFPNVERLRLCCGAFNGLMDFTDLFPRLSALNVLMMDNFNTMALIKHFGPQLSWLAFPDSSVDGDFCSTVNFSKLRGLQLMPCDRREMVLTGILRTAVNLETIVFDATIEENAIVKVFKSCRFLQYIRIYGALGQASHIVRVLAAVERGLFETLENASKKLKMALDLQPVQGEEYAPLLLKIGNIVNWLKIKCSEEFELEIQTGSSDTRNDMLKKLMAISLGVKIAPMHDQAITISKH